MEVVKQHTHVNIRQGGRLTHAAIAGDELIGAPPPMPTVEVLDEGTSLTTAVASLDFVGSAVTATASGDAVTVTVTGSSFATPAIVLGTSAAAGAATSTIRSDSTIAAFDATAPANVANVGVASSTGSVDFAARRDHGHALTYHDEPLTDGASNFIFDGGDVVVVTGVPN